MTKTLTEQWREGTLPDGAYYILVDKYEQNEPEIDVGVCYNSNFEWWIVKEVLAPVPSYDENKKLQEQNADLSKTIERLQEQLKEANEIIANFRTYDFTVNDENAEEYQVKYGIAGEKIYTNKKPSKEFERWRKKITKSFEKKLKSGV